MHEDTDALLDIIDEYLSGATDRAGLEAWYYHARLQAETERRKQAEAFADTYRQMFDLQVTYTLHNARWARAWKQAAKARRAWAGEVEGRVEYLVEQVRDLQAQLAVATAPAPLPEPRDDDATNPAPLAPCPYCHATGIDGAPWASAAQRSGHVGSCPRAPRSPAKTDRVPCPVCDQSYTQQGMGTHIARAHGHAALDDYHAARQRAQAAEAAAPAPPAPPDHPAWRCTTCQRSADVIAPSVADPRYCVGCITSARHAA